MLLSRLHELKEYKAHQNKTYIFTVLISVTLKHELTWHKQHEVSAFLKAIILIWNIFSYIANI
jgi:hypothetical protein